MNVRRCLLALLVVLSSWIEHGEANGERWSRQISNSEWIPLTNPRAQQSQTTQSTAASGLLPDNAHLQSAQIPPISLPPALQQQYQQQLLQLQKTQENIQRLLLLQQQLKAQQQLLQSQPFLPSGFSSSSDDKQTLHPGAITNLQTIPQLSPEVLVPPVPSSEALPPVFPAQNFLPQGPPQVHQSAKSRPIESQEDIAHAIAALSSAQTDALHSENQGGTSLLDGFATGPRQEAKQLKAHANLIPQIPALSETGEDEEVQLVYVPAETLAQRGQPKRGRNRKPYGTNRLQQNRENQPLDTGLSPTDQDVFARQLLQQLQREHAEKTQLLKDERMKEIARLNEEQKALERKARLQQEALLREQEIQRQREAEKKRKELEKLEEMAKQRELQRIREAREKQRQEEIERRRLAELRAKEERRKEEERQRKELELQRALEEQRTLEEAARTTPPSTNLNQPDSHVLALPLVRDQQLHRQHLTETSKPAKHRYRTRQRQRVQQQQYHEQSDHRDVVTTTPSPNQPPLSVYMGSATSNADNVKVTDVLKILKDAKTIAVLDTVGPETPQVFVGPTNLEPPSGYAKFDLPYLSSLDHNRVERKVDKLPFFVAPLSFDPPPGYSKIPFPAPHIGSVVVNTIDATEAAKDADTRHPNPTPLIEPNSYIEGPRGDRNGPSSTPPTYESPTTIYSQETVTSTPRYEPGYSTTTGSSSGSRFRFRQYYNDNKASPVLTSYQTEQQLPSKPKPNLYYDESPKATTPSSTQNVKFDTSVTYGDEILYSSTPAFSTNQGSISSHDDASTKEHDLAAQLALINQELGQHRNVVQKYNNNDQQYHPNAPSGPSLVGQFEGDVGSAHVNDVKGPVGPTQYNLPAELPAISPLLPGLVNSLVDKHELTDTTAATTPAPTTTTTPSTTTTTTTTSRTVSTTYRTRGRHRGRVVATRPSTTTQAPATRATIDRARRPYNRSRSRFTTTTEEYRDSIYEPTKSKTPETTQRYNNADHQRRTTSRSHKYRNREKNLQSENVQTHNVQAQQATAFDNLQSNEPSISAPSAAYLENSPSSLQQDSMNLNTFSENYPTTSASPVENYPPVRPNANAQSTLSDEYLQHENYPKNFPTISQTSNYPEEVRYQTGFDHSNLEKTPVNGFNYQAQTDSVGPTASQSSKDYPFYSGKTENVDYTVSVTTENSQHGITNDQQFSPIYEVSPPQLRPGFSPTGQARYESVDGGKLEQAIPNNDPNTEHVFVPLPEGKQEVYGLQESSTERPLEFTTEATTTSTTPVIIRQRVRGRIGGRVHQDSAVQTRPRGSQDEYVRFSAVNHESRQRHREGSRSRPRVRPQSHGSQVQTDSYDYVKIHAAQQQQPRPISTTPPPTTTPLIQTVQDDIDYGFIRQPNFRPVHPIDDRYNTPPVTFRPPLHQILPNDETAVASSPAEQQVLKNRPKYQQTPHRRPVGKSTHIPTTTLPTTTTTTTTETPSLTTLPPDNTVYTVKPKPRPEETKSTRVRSRTRGRGGRKRVSTTTTTESIHEANNELPPDENYPRILPQPLPETTVEQRPIYDENFDGTPQFAPAKDRPPQYYESTGENYPSQEFVLNFGNLPEQGPPREEYDQTQLASDPSHRYQHSSHTKSGAGSRRSSADIYGAESQWSTKLTKTSFQPSFAANNPIGDTARTSERIRSDMDKAPEIITAGPEVNSVTFLVSSDDKNNQKKNTEINEAESMMMSTAFGKKTGVQENNEKMNESTTKSTSVQSTKEINERSSFVGEIQKEDRSSTEMLENAEITKISKKMPDNSNVKKTGTRRKRVRVRVRPVLDDFVTAESQHFNSAVNSLAYDQYKYNPIREYRLTTTTEAPSATATLSDETPRRTIFQDFLEEVLKNDQAAVPELATSTTTELSKDAWTTAIPSTIVPVTTSKTEETTWKESQTVSGSTFLPITESEDRITTIDKSVTSSGFTNSPYDQQIASRYYDDESKSNSNREEDSRGNVNGIRSDGSWDTAGKDKQNIQDSLNDVPSLTKSYGAKIKDSKGMDDTLEIVQSTEKLDTTTTKYLESSAVDQEAYVPTGIETDKSNVLDKTMEGKEKHPKNHREKWSEVRYPSAFDRTRLGSWTYDVKGMAISSTTSIPGLVSKNKGDTSVKTLSDYVQAIFDSMKSAEEENVNDAKENTDANVDISSSSKLNEQDDYKSPVYMHDTTPLSITDDAKTTSLDETVIPQTSSDFVTRIDLESVTDLDNIFPTSTPDITTLITSEESSQAGDFPTTTTSTLPTTTFKTTLKNSTESVLGKVLRTSTTTKVSHMTEICYRGRCVMTKPRRAEEMDDIHLR